MTLDVLRLHRGQLLSVFETLVYDPISEWHSRQRINTEEQLQATAKKELNKIQNKISSHKTVKQEVASLIAAASDDTNLAQMFVGKNK